METIDAIKNLTSLFKSKLWFDKDVDETVYNHFCDLLVELEPTERQLILELTQQYLWISGTEYDSNLRTALAKLANEENINQIKKMYIFPIVKPTDEGRAKSGIGISYDIKALTPLIPKLRLIKPITLDNFEDFLSAPGTKENELLCLVDDFIGTGDTLNQCLEKIGENMKINLSNLRVIAISCQKETNEELNRRGIITHINHLVPKGITDFNLSPELEKKKELMRTIEKNIPGSNSVSLGWQESEAVITLKRTPDNTFPIFWKKFRKKGKWINAPFLRVDYE